MMSTSLHQYPSAFGHVPTPSMVDHQQHHHLATQHMSPSPLDTLAHTSQYAALQFHPNRHVLPSGKPMGKPHRLSYTTGPIAPRNQRDMLHERSGRGSATSGPVRRRISRACDQCNQLRTKCDGKQSCAHCIEFGLTCEYIRERKKRGKASRKDIAQQQAAAAAAAAAGNGSQPSESSPTGTPQPQIKISESSYGGSPKLPEGQRPLPEMPTRSASMATTRELEAPRVPESRTMSMSAIDTTHSDIHQISDSMHPPRLQTQTMPVHNNVPEYAPIDDFQRTLPYQQPPHPMMPNGLHPIVPSHTGHIEYSDSPYPVLSPQAAHTQPPPSAYRLADDTSNMGYLHSPATASSGWMLPSPTATMYAGAPRQFPMQPLRYPVLQPLAPHLTNIMPIQLACDLLEVYFQSASSAYMQLDSPYVLGYVFRKSSFLRTNNPRACSPALLASMLWIGCLTSDLPYLASSPATRSQLSEKLINLTISLLKPLVHQTPGESEISPASYGASSDIGADGASVNGYNMSPAARPSEVGIAGVSGSLDDVATYMHLAIVISASEYKAASLRWWNTAWALARELKFGKEMPVTPPPEVKDEDAPGELDVDHLGSHPSAPDSPAGPTEEQREEQRRIWWLLYTVDRHLALCYNRPLALSDVECSGLLQPLDDNVWQAGEFFEDSAQTFSDPTFRRRGAPLKCTGHSVFGFFLPLMTILGEIVDLKYAKSHPRFGKTVDGDEHANEIRHQLEDFERSLYQICNTATKSAAHDDHQLHTPLTRPRIAASNKILEAYGTYLTHIMHILLNYRWDPISLLDDSDRWTETQGFVDATQHATYAGEALGHILEHDAQFRHMPFFFDIYLLQGSFLFLLMADRLGGEASQNAARACQVAIHALEASTATLDIGYQRNLRKIMRSSLHRLHGHGMIEDAQNRRKALSLYRWTRDGTGLAL